MILKEDERRTGGAAVDSSTVPDPSLERHLSPMTARELLMRARTERR